MGKTVALYARCSTKTQQFSIEMQLRDLRAYCSQRGLTVVREYVDEGYSGSLDSRPALDKLMHDARKAQFRAVAVWRFDRFARSTRHLVQTLEEFKTRKIQFTSYGENIDTDTPMGAAMFTIIAAMAQLERDLIRERVVGGLRNAVAKGVKLGRPVVLRDAAPIQALARQGVSQREIAKRLGLSKTTVQRLLLGGPKTSNSAV